MIRARRLLTTILGLTGIVSTAGAYSHFVHYTSRTAPYNPALEKFDVNAVPNKTVTFFVSDSSATQVSRADQFPSLLSAIREAARAWNGVETSDLRVAFGGLASSNTPQNTPGADIVLDEMDPLVLGLTSTNARNNIAFGSGGAFVPITRPTVRLNRNLSVWNSTASGPSFTEAFFLTAVHEMGHALGLQHTFTASAMSTEITRATSLYSPLTPDDIAGISYLYPRGLGATTGSIAGRVTIGGQPVHLASVVAIQPSGPAISALTDPDGRYRIDGVPNGGYYVYVHPLPPSARPGVAPGDLWLPVDPDGQPRAAEQAFDTLFYQVSSTTGTRDYNQATMLFVGSGSFTDNINFATNRRSSYSIPSVTTYSYFDQTAVRPGFLNSRGTLVASGTGLTTNGALTAGLSVSVMGGAAILGSGAIYAYGGAFVAMDLVAIGGSGPRHLIYSLPNDIYVQPSGMTLVQNRPPVISSATPGFETNGTRSVALTGSTLSSETKFYFDGFPGTVLRFDDPTKPVVAPPPGVTGQRSVITAFNPDGQNSMFTQSNSPASFTYDAGDAGSVTLSPSLLPAGTETFVEITGTSGNFVDGTSLGFGSSDVQVRRSWVVARNKIWANVWVPTNAAGTAVPATVISGFQIVSQPFAAQVTAYTGRASLTSQVAIATQAFGTASATTSSIYPGATVTVSGANLSNGTLTVSDRPATIVAANPTQITFVVPSGLTPGPAVLKYTSGSDSASVVIQIDPVPPDVRTVLASSDVIINASHPARPGDTLNVMVASLAEANAVPDSRRVKVRIAGVDHPTVSITPRSGLHQVQVVLSPAVASGQAPLTVAVDGHDSLPYTMPVTR